MRHSTGSGNHDAVLNVTNLPFDEEYYFSAIQLTHNRVFPLSVTEKVVNLHY